VGQVDRRVWRVRSFGSYPTCVTYPAYPT